VTAAPDAAAPAPGRRDRVGGAAFALAAGVLWGIVFVTPLLLPEYPAALLSMGRYLAFGLIAIPLALADRRNLARFTRADWLEAARLSAVGNLLYYLLLASAIQRAGGPLPTMIIGTLPVVIAVTSNLRDGHRDGRLPWGRLAPSLVLIAGGIGLVNHVELDAMRAQAGTAGVDLRAYALGALLAVGAVACWTWYPVRNADWLRAHPDRSPRSWATAQGVATLPMAFAGYVVVVSAMAAWPSLAAGGHAAGGAATAFPLPFGPRPAFFIGMMCTVGLLASWAGTLCWNEASQRLPTTLAGQLIVFETLSALAGAFALRGHWPPPLTFAGIALLVAGVAWALRASPEPIAAEGHAH
jgi:drug/metabolite transporter (DMT)-like permease